jgi:hypothetical protein
MTVDEGALLGVGGGRDGSADVLRCGEAAHRGAGHDVLVGVAAPGPILYVYVGSRIQRTRAALPRDA